LIRVLSHVSPCTSACRKQARATDARIHKLTGDKNGKRQNILLRHDSSEQPPAVDCMWDQNHLSRLLLPFPCVEFDCN